MKESRGAGERAGGGVGRYMVCRGEDWGEVWSWILSSSMS